MKRFISLLPVAGIAAGILSIMLMPMWALVVGQRIGYAFPIDYGEGPLLRQLQYLQHGGTLPGLYGDPGAAPYLIVNYPPVYLLASQFLTWFMPALMAGRVVSALAGVLAAVSIWMLLEPTATRPYSRLFATLTTLTWFAIPIVREWSGVMRVDMLGVTLGLIGLVAVRQKRPIVGIICIALALLTKPSLIAAPLALGVWLLTQPWRQWVRVGVTGIAVIGIIAGGITLVGGNIWLHVIQANVNLWDEALARGFWREAWQLHWPLMCAAVVIVVSIVGFQGRSLLQPPSLSTSMAIAYTIGGIFVGLGIGKVGAYANYFLEWYAGMIWILGIGAQRALQQTSWSRWLAVACVAAGSLTIVRYIPLWSETYPKPYGMIEQQRPPRLSIGGYGVWQDYQREGQILRANAVTAQALNEVITRLGGPVFTDVPGVAAQADVLTPMQVFEHRQLLDVGLWDQRPLLRMLANGEIPVVVLDYLGNWMTPESIALISSRYAQSGSRGSFDIYQPIAVGAPQDVDFSWGSLRLTQIALPPPIQRSAYEPGYTLPVRLTFAGQDTGATHRVMLTLRDSNDMVVSRSIQPLFAGALNTSDLVDGPLQHLQALSIPARSNDGMYQLAVQIDDGEHVVVTVVAVQRNGGVMSGDGGYFVPGAINAFIMQNGGTPAWGEPLMPAMPFADQTLQCFTYRCVVLAADGQFQVAPLGEWLRGAMAVLPSASDMESYDFTREIVQQGGFDGEEFAVADIARRDGARVVWLRRDGELWYEGDTVSRGAAGQRYMRLPGIPYRWPVSTP